MTCIAHNPEIYDRLSEKQRRAVMHGEGPMLVTAGPGSGKTHVLTSRILYLIQERQISPGQILVITFTKEAARSMQSRYLEMAEKFRIFADIPIDTRSGQVSFGTFHSFFFQILRSSERYTHYRIIGETDKQKLLYPLLTEIKIRRGETSSYYDPVSREEINRILSAVSYDKNTGKTQEARDRLQEPWRECYEEILRGYEGQKEQRRQLDLDDLLTLTVRELGRDTGILQYWRSRYKHVLVDEFQDCNPVQYEVIKMLYTTRGNLFAVGDDDQAIYGFRGADPGIMRRFREEYTTPAYAVAGLGGRDGLEAGEKGEPHAGKGVFTNGPSHVVLGRNYRCSPEIVDASDKVISCNRQRVSKQLTSGREAGGSVLLKGFPGGREERSYVLSQCQGKTSRELDRFAVLFRTNNLMGAFAAQLMQAGIPFVTREKIGSVYEHFVARDVMDYFRAAYGCRERQLFLRIWNRPRLRVGREALDSPAVDFDRIRRFYSEAPYENLAAVRDVEQFERKLEQLRRFSLELGITFIRRGFGYEDYLRRRAGSSRELLENWLEVLDWLEEDCRGHETFEKWERYQEQATSRLSREGNCGSTQSGGNVRGNGGRSTRSNGDTQRKGIHILTMHASKGLEFDRVFLMDVNEGNIPKLKRGEAVTETLLEEERRLFYVGMTRARDSLELLYQTGTKERPRLPSAFLQPLTACQKGINQSSSDRISSYS